MYTSSSYCRRKGVAPQRRRGYWRTPETESYMRNAVRVLADMVRVLLHILLCLEDINHRVSDGKGMGWGLCRSRQNYPDLHLRMYCRVTSCVLHAGKGQLTAFLCHVPSHLYCTIHHVLSPILFTTSGSFPWVHAVLDQ